MRILFFVAACCLPPAVGWADSIDLAQGGTGASTRIVGGWDSLAAFGVVAGAMFIAWCLNHSLPRVRSFGIFFAALSCAAVATWFLAYVRGTGFLENPKPNQTPLDSAKPALLWVQGLVALIAATGLAAVAYRQYASEQVLVLSLRNERGRYGRIARWLHWTIAILFIVMIPMGVFTSIIPEQTVYRNAYYVVHKTVGVVLMALIAVRLGWNRMTPKPALAASLTGSERVLAKTVHRLLYVLMLAMPLTGFMMTSYHGYPTFFFAWDLGPYWAPSDTATIIWGSLHKYLLQYLVYLVLGAHLMGALKHYLFDKRSALIKRMVG